jgi:hypothetical protein
VSTIADQIYQIARDLPEAKAAEILEFATFIKDEETVGNGDFFAMAGIWQSRNIDLDSLRRQAWPERRE